MSKKLIVKTSKAPVKTTDLIVAFVGEGQSLIGEAKSLFAQTKQSWTILANAARFSGKSGQTFSVLAPPNVAADRFLFVGIGKTSQKDGPELTSLDWTNQGGKIFALIQKVGVQQATVLLDHPDITPENIAEIAAGMHLRNYDFDKYKSQPDDEETQKPQNLAITLLVNAKPAADKAIKVRHACVEGTLLARDLQNEPPNVLGPVEFAKIASSLSTLGVKVQILTPVQMKKLGMNALLAVGQGSERPSRLAIMQWNGGKKNDQPIAFVGKGVVFDTGGISIKPAGSMQDMKGDMGGAAAVTGLMKTLALRKAKVNVVGVIGLAENMPDGNAYRPGDIVTAMNGTTIEIINTDAEGRLVLADALWYTQKTFKPKFMINLATLTGAIMVALGQDYAGLFSNDEELASKLEKAGALSGEKLWRMPLGPAYDKMIKSRFADIKNTGGRFGGAITAAQFLQRFVNDVPWAHLDIAGTGFGAPGSDINTSWASGFGVAVLDQLIKDNYEN